MLIQVATLLLLFLTSCTASETPQQLSEVCFNNNSCFSAEIADTPDSREKGLMYRESIPNNHGMLFSFTEESHYSFWMKNTIIPLDIIWISTQNNVVHIEKETTPYSLIPLTPSKKARYVFEINGGLSQELGITLNSTFRLYK